MLRNDNWGDRARFGMFIVGNEAVPEAEWWAMLPPNVSVHAARITATAPWARWQKNRVGVDLADDLIRGSQQFSAMRLSVVVIGHSSSSFVGGKGWDEAVVDNLSGILGSNVIATTNGLDTLAALHASGVRRPFLVMPPWYNEETVDAGVRYYEDHGFEPSGHLSFDPGSKWRDLPTGDLTRHGLGFEQDVKSLHKQIKASCPATADGVLIAGTGFRCVAILESLEQELKRPIISANQASMWHCLKLANVQLDVSGYGNVLKI
jgi:maleate isomerase